MNYYAIYNAEGTVLLAEGTARECKKKLGCASIDSFYALANRSRRGINKKYKVVIKSGGNVLYPTLGKDDPVFDMTEEEKEQMMDKHVAFSE